MLYLSFHPHDKLAEMSGEDGYPPSLSFLSFLSFSFFPFYPFFPKKNTPWKRGVLFYSILFILHALEFVCLFVRVHKIEEIGRGRGVAMDGKRLSVLGKFYLIFLHAVELSE